MTTLPKGRLEHRLHGLETEYGITVRFQVDSRLVPSDLSAIPGLKFIEKVGQTVGMPEHQNYFLENGARCYLDTGFHPEYSTPECESIRNVVHADRAGELILEKTALLLEAEYSAKGLPIIVDLYKNNIDAQGNCWGCHENYTGKRDIKLMDYAKPLIPFFVTRQVFTGAGRVSRLRNGQIGYHLGARSFFISTDVGGSTMKDRAIINTRDEPHADPEKYRRLHVIVGDSNMGEVPDYMKLATASMVMSLIEERIIDEAFINKVSLARPVRAIRQVALDMKCKRNDLKGLEGNLSALGIQRSYFDLALKHQDIFESQYKTALRKWGELLDSLERNPMDAYHDVDWVRKWMIIQGYMGKHHEAAPHLPAQIDLKYHNIISKRGIIRGRSEEKEGSFAVDRDLVQRLCENPPDEERPRIRGNFVRLMQQLGYQSRNQAKADWAFLSFKPDGQRDFEAVKMLEIHGNDLGELKKIFLEAVPEDKLGDPEVKKILQETFPN